VTATLHRRDLLVGVAIAAGGAMAFGARAGAGEQPAPARGNVNDLVVRYWNERDGERRRALVA
jgi:hypothetical protein